MKTLCAWCGALLRDGPAGDISHGICAKCQAAVFGEPELSDVGACDVCGNPDCPCAGKDRGIAF